MKRTHFDNEFAGASAIGHLFAVLIVGAVGAILEYTIYKSQFMFTGLSQDASNTIFYLENGMLAVAILYLIAVILSHWINEKSSANQGV
jgi:hypothetical protein